MAETIYDPLRRREVALTPEERVRQWFIGVLIDSGMPAHLMMSEASLSFGSAGKSYRADIVVYDRKGAPAMIVECKRPEVALTREVLEQALRYDLVLQASCIVITNGRNTAVARRTPEGVIWQEGLPSYQTLLSWR